MYTIYKMKKKSKHIKEAKIIKGKQEGMGKDNVRYL